MTLFVGAVLAFAVGLLATAMGLPNGGRLSSRLTMRYSQSWEHPHTHSCLSLRWVHNDPQQE